MKIPLLLASVLVAASSAHALTVDFEDLTVPTSGFYNGGPVTNSNGWVSSGTFFNNNYNSSFGGYWSGWSYSRVNRPAGGGFTNQYASAAGLGSSGPTYAVAYSGAYFNLPSGYAPVSVDLTNTAYAYFSVLNGDSFSRPFAEGDYFTVTLTGYAAPAKGGNVTGSATFTLADYRNGLASIVNTWQSVDLTALGGAASVGLSFVSTDTGQFGINTPTYVAADNLVLTAVPEPTSLAGMALLALVARRRSR